MTSVSRLFVGIDYHQDNVQVCVLDQDEHQILNRSLDNDADVIRQAICERGQVAGVAIEACCGAANLADELHNQTGWPVQMAHPGYVARLKQSPDKSDFSDARLLADLERVGYVPKVWLAPEQIRQLRRLIRHRQQLVNSRRSVKLRLRALLRENRIKAPSGCNAWTKAWLAWVANLDALSQDDRWLMDQHLADLQHLTTRVKAVEQRLADRVQDDPVVERLLTFRGVGFVTAVTMRAEIGYFDRFGNGKQLSRFCGLSPRNASSGHRQADAGLIKAGNPGLRTVLIELGHRLIRQQNSHWSKLGYQMLRRGKPRNVAVAAVANRWVRWLYHQMQPNQIFVQTSAQAQQKGGAAPSAIRRRANPQRKTQG